MSIFNSKIAYLNSKYTALSHTFIHREVRALRKQGVDVHTFSIRKPSQGDLFDSNSQGEGSVVSLLNNLRSIVHDNLFLIFTRPKSFFRGLLFSQKLSPPGIKSRLLHVAYHLEASRLVLELEKKDISHVHVHMGNNAAAVALIATKISNKLSYSLTIHGPAEFLDIETGKLREKVVGAMFVRCISEFCRSQVMAVVPTEHWKKLHIVHCAVEKLKNDKHNPGELLNLLFVGRLVPEKGPAILLEVLSTLVTEKRIWQLNIVGQGPIENELKNQATKLGISTRVHFLGALSSEQTLKQMEKSDVLVLPSFMEGLPVVLMEAMARSKVVVSTQIAGIPELVSNRKNGLLVLPGAQSDLKYALQDIMQYKLNVEELGKRAKETVDTDFNVEIEGAKMRNLFENYNLIKENKPKQVSGF